MIASWKGEGFLDGVVEDVGQGRNEIRDLTYIEVVKRI